MIAYGKVALEVKLFNLRIYNQAVADTFSCIGIEKRVAYDGRLIEINGVSKLVYAFFEVGR